MRSRISLVLLAASLAVLSVTSAASAAYVSFDSSFGLEISDQTGSETNSITIANGSGSNDYVIRDTAGITVDGVDCEQDSATQATCEAVTRSENVGYAELGDGDDTLAVEGTFAGFDIFGGSGSDTILAGSGDNTIFGEDGQDWISPGLGSDAIVGGDGTDTVSYSDRSTDTTVYPDGTNADGSQTVVATASGESGEQDKISADIENLQGGSGSDTLYGNAETNRFSCGAGTDTVIGAQSADTLDSDCEIDTRNSAPNDSAPPSSGSSDTSGGQAGSGNGSLAVGLSSGLSKFTILSKTTTARLRTNRTVKLKVSCSVFAQSRTCGVSGTLRYKKKTVAIATGTFAERKDHLLVFKFKKKIYKQLRKAIKIAKEKRRKLTLSLSLRANAVIEATALPGSATNSTKVVLK